MGRKKNFFFANSENEDVNELAANIESEKKEDSKLEEKQVAKQRFKIFGQEDITFSKIDFIDYQKISNKMLFLQFHLMGQFDDKGEYYIKDDIKKDLIRVQKEIQEEDDKGFLAQIKYAKVLFNFEIEVEYKDEKAKADLYIIEKFDDQTVKTLLDSFNDLNDADFRIKVRQRYNLVDVAITVRDEEVPNLNIWIYWQNEEYMFWKDLYEMGSQFFVLRALAILEQYGEIGEKIIERYNEKLTQFEDFLPNRKYTKAKEILDETLCEFGGIEKIDDGKGKLQALTKEFNKPFYVSERTQAMLFEKDSTNKKSVKEIKTKQENYNWNDNGVFKSATAGKISNAKDKRAKAKAQKKGTVFVSVSSNGQHSEANNERTAESHQTERKKTEYAQINHVEKKDKDTVDQDIMKVITEDLDSESGAIYSENAQDQILTQTESNGNNIRVEKNLVNEEDEDQIINVLT